MRVVVTGGGSGGHIYPALAIARGLVAADPHAEILYLGTNHGLEHDLVPRENLSFRTIHVRGILVPGLTGKAMGVLQAFIGLVESWGEIRAFKPDVVIGTGGYVSGPVGLAAEIMGIPLIIQEQNAWPGLTNRRLARKASLVFVPFEEAVRHFPPQTRVIVSGNPVDPPKHLLDRTSARQSLGLDANVRLLMATGGSQGAEAINRLMLDLLPLMAKDASLGAVWATGRRYYEAVLKAIHRRFPDGLDENRIRVVEYFYQIATAYQACDLFVGRAGAMTTADCQAFSVPMILVPSPHVSEDHQTRNAEALARRGAAVVLPEADIAQRTSDVIDLLKSSEQLKAMAEKSAALYDPKALTRIVTTVLELAGGVKEAAK